MLARSVLRGASQLATSPRRAPMSIGRCSMPTGHWFSHAPQVVHCQSTFSVYSSTSFVSPGFVSTAAAPSPTAP